jgi:hypothetical protein
MLGSIPATAAAGKATGSEPAGFPGCDEPWAGAAGLDLAEAIKMATMLMVANRRRPPVTGWPKAGRWKGQKG